MSKASSRRISGIEPPHKYWLAADLPTEFASFRQYCELIFRGPYTFADKDEAARVTYILLWGGQEGLRVFNTWDISVSDSKKVDVIWSRFKGAKYRIWCGVNRLGDSDVKVV